MSDREEILYPSDFEDAFDEKYEVDEDELDEDEKIDLATADDVEEVNSIILWYEVGRAYENDGDAKKATQYYIEFIESFENSKYYTDIENINDSYVDTKGAQRVITTQPMGTCLDRNVASRIIIHGERVSERLDGVIRRLYFVVGVCYHFGKGVKKNWDLAERMYCKMRSDDALCNLGAHYMSLMVTGSNWNSSNNYVSDSEHEKKQGRLICNVPKAKQFLWSALVMVPDLRWNSQGYILRSEADPTFSGRDHPTSKFNLGVHMVLMTIPNFPDLDGTPYAGGNYQRYGERGVEYLRAVLDDGEADAAFALAGFPCSVSFHPTKQLDLLKQGAQLGSKLCMVTLNRCVETNLHSFEFTPPSLAQLTEFLKDYPITEKDKQDFERRRSENWVKYCF